MQHLTLQSQPTMTIQQLHERRQAALERHRLEHERQLQRSEFRTVKTDDQAEDEIDHSCWLRKLFLAMLPVQAASRSRKPYI